MGRRPPVQEPPGARKAWRVYLLRCVDGSLYAGITNDLERRLAVHNRGRGAAYTRSRLPVALAYSQPASDRSAALRGEAALRRLSRREKLELVQAYDQASRRPKRRARKRAVRRPVR